MSRVLITTDYLRPGDQVDQYLQAAGHDTIHLPMSGPRDVDELVAALNGVDAALIANEPMSADVLQAARSLRVIVRTGVGYDSVDIEAATVLNIAVSNLPGINANAVAEYTIGMILAAARGLVRNASSVDAGGWPRQSGNELRGSTLGLIGYGATARAVVPLAQAFGMKILCATGVPLSERFDTSVEFLDFDGVLKASDYVSIHTSLTTTSRNLFNAAAFARMKPSAHLINTARGAIVDEAALVEAVRSSTIAGAGLDVACQEPLPSDSPLREVDGIVVYPHMAGQTAQARLAAGLASAAELVSSLHGDPQYAVNEPAARKDAHS